MTRLLFREVQNIRHVWWIMVIIYGTAGLMWYSFILQVLFDRPVGTNPGPDWLMWLLWLLIGIGLPILFYTMKLIVEVTDDYLSIRYVPFVNRRILFAEIKKCEARTYRAIREHGGWGIRGLFGKGRAYTVSGNRGVELELQSGQQIMLGSQKPQELALAIEAKLAG
jgi:hypothetical protein